MPKKENMACEAELFTDTIKKFSEETAIIASKLTELGLSFINHQDSIEIPFLDVEIKVSGVMDPEFTLIHHGKVLLKKSEAVRVASKLVDLAKSGTANEGVLSLDEVKGFLDDAKIKYIPTAGGFSNGKYVILPGFNKLILKDYFTDKLVKAAAPEEVLEYLKTANENYKGLKKFSACEFVEAQKEAIEVVPAQVVEVEPKAEEEVKTEEQVEPAPIILIIKKEEFPVAVDGTVGEECKAACEGVEGMAYKVKSTAALKLKEECADKFEITEIVGEGETEEFNTLVRPYIDLEPGVFAQTLQASLADEGNKIISVQVIY